MQVSIETLSGLRRRMTIGVPAEMIESKVHSRLREAAKNFHMKGFRKGKVPLKVIKTRFGKGLRQEVLGEVMSQSYFEAVNQENVRPAGQPRIEPLTLEEGKDLEFTAVFEVYPEITLGDFSKIKVERKSADILDADIDKMIETLRTQRMTYHAVDRPAREKDRVNMDFEGTMDGRPFEGGSAAGVALVLGSKRMIPGFEEGLAGRKKGDEVTLELVFPKDYHDEKLAGKPVVFKVTLNAVEEPRLPELDDAFFASFDVKEGGMEAFRTEVAANMARELKNASRNNVKNQVFEGLLELHDVRLPKALVDNEIKALREQTAERLGGADRSRLPDEMFRSEAEKRTRTALIMAEIIRQKDIQAQPDTVRSLVEEIAESYENPREVVKWYYSDKHHLEQVESMAVELAAMDAVLESAQVKEVKTSYEEALKPSTSKKKKQASKKKQADPRHATVEQHAESQVESQAESK